MSVTPFSTAVRERSTAAHSSSEGSGFMSELLKGDGTLDDYIALVAQHYFIYVALEAAADNMRSEPVASAFITDALTRLPELLWIRRRLGTRLIGGGARLFVGIDAPDFNLGLEARLRGAGLKTVHYVCPSIWA